MLTRLSQLNSKVQPSRTWTPELCHAMISDEAAYMDVRQGPGTGVWTADAEGFCLSALLRPENRRIKFPDIVQALSQVAAKPNGLTRVDIGFDAFSFCHKMGFLHTEASTGPDPTEVTYFFASPVHRRYTTTIRRLITVLIGILESHTGASYPVPTATPHLITARSCRYA